MHVDRAVKICPKTAPDRVRSGAVQNLMGTISSIASICDHRMKPELLLIPNTSPEPSMCLATAVKAQVVAGLATT